MDLRIGVEHSGKGRHDALPPSMMSAIDTTIQNFRITGEIGSRTRNLQISLVRDTYNIPLAFIRQSYQYDREDDEFFWAAPQVSWPAHEANTLEGVEEQARALALAAKIAACMDRFVARYRQQLETSLQQE